MQTPPSWTSQPPDCEPVTFGSLQITFYKIISQSKLGQNVSGWNSKSNLPDSRVCHDTQHHLLTQIRYHTKH